MRPPGASAGDRPLNSLHERARHAQRQKPVRRRREVRQARQRDGRGDRHHRQPGGGLRHHPRVRRVAGAEARRRGQGDHQVHRGAHRQALRSPAMMYRRLAALPIVAACACLAAAAEEKALTPAEARKKVGEKILVEMTVKAAKDRLEKHGEIYLDSEENFKDKKNFAVVITRTGAASLKKAGVGDPAGHYKDKKIRATGKVKEVEKIPRIEIDDASQIKVVKTE